MDNKTLNLSELIKIFKNEKKTIISIAASGIALALLYLFLVAPTAYQASSSILPPKQAESGGLSSLLQNMGGGAISLGGLGGGSGNAQMQVFSDILKSNNAAIIIGDICKLKEKKHFKELKHEEYLKAIKDMFDNTVEKSGVISINTEMKTGLFPSAEDKAEAAKISADVANAALTALDSIVRNRVVSGAKRSKNYVIKALAEYRAKLDSVETSLENFQKKNKILKIEEQTEALVKQAIDVGVELAKSESELNLAKTEYSKNSSVVKQLESKTSFLRNQYSKVQTGGLTGNDAFAIPFKNIPSLTREYVDLFRDKKIYEQVLLYLETQRHQEAIQESKDIPIVEPLDRATIPEVQTAPKKRVSMILATFLSACIAFGYVSFKALYKGRLLNKG